MVLYIRSLFFVFVSLSLNILCEEHNMNNISDKNIKKLETFNIAEYPYLQIYFIFSTSLQKGEKQPLIHFQKYVLQAIIRISF